MATIKTLDDEATEIRIDGLNAVLFYKNEPVAAVVAGVYYETEARIRGEEIIGVRDWAEKNGIELVRFRPQSFFDNILKIYMNPAALDMPESEDDRG